MRFIAISILRLINAFRHVQFFAHTEHWTVRTHTFKHTNIDDMLLVFCLLFIYFFAIPFWCLNFVQQPSGCEISLLYCVCYSLSFFIVGNVVKFIALLKTTVLIAPPPPPTTKLFYDYSLLGHIGKELLIQIINKQQNTKLDSLFAQQLYFT